MAAPRAGLSEQPVVVAHVSREAPGKSILAVGRQRAASALPVSFTYAGLSVLFFLATCSSVG